MQGLPLGGGGGSLVEVDDGATQSLHGGGEGATGSGTGLVEHGCQHFALYVEVSDIRGDMLFVFFTYTVNMPDPINAVCLFYLHGKHAGSNPETFRLQPVMAFTPKKAWIILCKTDPDPIWMACSRFDQTHLVWKQAGVQESSGPVSSRTQLACYQFPTFRLSSVLPQMPRMIVCKTSLDLI